MLYKVEDRYYFWNLNLNENNNSWLSLIDYVMYLTFNKEISMIF